MKYQMHISAAFALLSGIAAVAHAAPPVKDVPHGYWAAGAVQKMTSTKIMPPLNDGKFHGDAPVTRYELAVTLDRFIHYIEQSRKPLHVTTGPAAVPAHASARVKKSLAFLTSQGFIPPNSPLVVGNGTQPVTAEELSDAIADVTVELNDRALPATKDAGD